MDMQALQAEEEQLRQEIAKLPDEQKQYYYQQEKLKVKDPDTYAVLNWFVVVGLHHFYLGKFGRGAINIVLILLGLAFLELGGWIVLILVFLLELPQLFFSQRIVYRYNNQVMASILDEIHNKGIS
ncbi:TM2 domain-containing protein [Catenovulum sp. SM1970]|uniref:TM2 domain-containing protein n=1 Tax=Marinifaba aquimaris TaxID=2741323 RepID=UPI001574BC88|nr:TM2 domain-containing protein [Marinifaba aquimaris]NTS77635.1 TM2 domain-containing protein [Marinifaba aquimaris]